MIQHYIQFFRLLPRVRPLAEGGGEISVPIVDQFTKAVDHAASWDGDTKFLALVVLVLGGLIWYVHNNLKEERAEKLELRRDNARLQRINSDDNKSMKADLEQLCQHVLDEQGKEKRNRRKREEAEDREQSNRTNFLPSRRIPRRKQSDYEEEDL